MAVQIESHALTDGQIQSIAEYAREIARGLEIADEDFDAKRRVIDLLDVRATLSVENGEYLVYASCILDSDTLLIKKTTTKS